MTSSLAIIKPIASPAELLHHHDEMAKYVQAAFKQEVDYGRIPGTGDKPTLLKPGAEKLCLAFGAHPEYDLIESEVDHNVEVPWIKRRKVWNNAHRNDKTYRWENEQGTSIGRYRYRYRCRIVARDGQVLGWAEGVASTLESKYIDRPRDCENTVCKMAQKRAFVGAVLHAFALSNRFTQDVEDFQDRPENQPVNVTPPAKDEAPKTYCDSSASQQWAEKYLLQMKVGREHWEEIHLRMLDRAMTYDELKAVVLALRAEKAKSGQTSTAAEVPH